MTLDNREGYPITSLGPPVIFHGATLRIGDLFQGEHLFQNQKGVYFSPIYCRNLPEAGKRGVRNTSSNFVDTEWYWVDIDKIRQSGGTPEDFVAPLNDYIVRQFGECERHFVNSGNGLHVYIKIPPLRSHKEFASTKENYIYLAAEIDAYLRSMGLAFDKIDLGVWDAARLMRLPGTENNKEEKGYGTQKCYLIESLGSGASQQLYDYLTAKPKAENNPKNLSTKASLAQFLPVLAKYNVVPAKRGPKFAGFHCLFHAPDHNCSQCLYENPTGLLGVDFHLSMGEKGRYFSAAAFLSMAKHGKIVAEHKREFAAEVLGENSDSGGLRLISDIITDHLKAELVPLCKTEKAIYSASRERDFSKSDVVGFYDQGILSEIQMEGLGLSDNQRGYEDVTALAAVYGRHARIAYETIYAELPFLHDLPPAALPVRLRKEFAEDFGRLLAIPIGFRDARTQENRRESLLTVFKKTKKMIETTENVSRMFEFPAHFRVHFDAATNMWSLAIQFPVVAEVYGRNIPKMFEQEKFFVNVAIYLGLLTQVQDPHAAGRPWFCVLMGGV